MRPLPITVLIAALALVCVVSTAQEAQNLALGKPYQLSPAPADKYGDNQGPEPHSPGAWLRGELTDGVRGPSTSFSAAEFVGWRDADYVKPITVTIDMGEPVTIGEVRTTCFGAPKSAVPPPEINVWVKSPDFPVDAFVEVGRMRPDKPHDQGKNDLYHYSLPDLSIRATAVRLDYQEPTWSYLFTDEIEVLAATGEARMLPAQDVTVEAEAFGEGSAAQGASGTAVLLDTVGEKLDITVPLPAGEYTVRIRSQAVKPDTFSEILPHLGEQQMRPQAVTNSVFTWQRSHFTPRDGQRQSHHLGWAPGLIDQVTLGRAGQHRTRALSFRAGHTLWADGRPLP